MRLILLLCLLSAGLAPSAFAQAEHRISVRGILVAASNEPGATDERLQPYETELRRVLGGQRFLLLGEGRAALSAPGEASIFLGRKHRLEIHGTPAGASGVRMQIRWSHAGRTLKSVPLLVRPDAPAVVAGPKHTNEETLAVIVLAQ